jgi:DNA processing protein
MNIQVLWIWLSLACTPGSVTFSKLISKFETPKAIFEATDDQLSAVLGRSSKDLRALSDKNTDKAEEIFKYCTSKNIGILNYSDNNFPENLRNIPTPPVLLYYRGVLPDFKNSFCVSVVGTRRLSEYGLKNAFQISSDLAKAGATIVSGMALGIDGVSHAGALSGGGVTVAVLGSGIDVCYPSEHKLLARNIVKNGCVFTEFAPGTRPERHNFPRRNRIISGLSEATLVIEGRE